jgi:hypothetical protein
MLPEPATTALTIIKLIDTGCKIAKLLYSFIASVIEAPNEIRSLVSSLYSLNKSLCQIQSLLLDPSFGSVHGTDTISGLEEVLANCVRVYSHLHPKVDKAQTVLDGDSRVKRLWVDVKWVFGDSDIESLLASLEREKATLMLIINTMSLYVPTNDNLIVGNPTSQSTLNLVSFRKTAKKQFVSFEIFLSFYNGDFQLLEHRKKSLILSFGQAKSTE